MLRSSFIGKLLLLATCFILLGYGYAHADENGPAIPKEVAPNPTIPQTAPAKESPPPQSTQKFMVNQIQVVGNTLLTAQELAPILAQGEGKEIDLGTLNSIANQITDLYAKKGYLLARAYVPPQRIENGIAKIYVLEGRVGKITVEGNSAYSSDFIKYFVNNSIQNGFFKFEDFQKAILLLNEFQDLQVRAFFKPGAEPGTSDLTLRVNDKTPVHVGMDYNNFGNPFIGRNRAGLEVWDGNLTGGGDLADMRTVFPFPSNQHPFFQFDYNHPISPSGTKLGVSFASADIKAGQQLQTLDIRGSAQIYGINLSQPLIRSLTESSNIGAALFYKNINNFIFGSTLTSFDRIREAQLSYDHRWLSSQTQDLFEISGTQGLGQLLGGMPKNYVLASRPGVDDTFTRFNSDIVHIVRVLGNNFLVLRGEGQYALAPLPITEQYSVGGPDSVPGYEQAEMLGDSGWVASAELRVPLNSTSSQNPIQAFVTAATGDAFLRFPQAGEFSTRHISGAGVGIRANFGQSTSARVEVGFPIDPPANLSAEKPVLYAQFATQF